MHPTLVQTTQGPMVKMPQDAAGDCELLTINQANARLGEILEREACSNTGQVEDSCLCGPLDDLLQGIR